MILARNNISFKRIVLLIILALILTAGIYFPFAGRALVAEDKPVKSDLIVLLMGSEDERIPGAVDLYQQGYGDKILMVRNNIPGFDELIKRGVNISHNTERAMEIALQMGVDEDAIIILPGAAESTQDEAVAVREYLRDHEDIDSIIVTTSRYHSGRSKKIFTKAMKGLDREVRVISCPSPYGSFNEDEWWKRRTDSFYVFLEHLKLANFYFREQFEL